MGPVVSRMPIETCLDGLLLNWTFLGVLALQTCKSHFLTRPPFLLLNTVRRHLLPQLPQGRAPSKTPCVPHLLTRNHPVGLWSR
jgi:hypothetical protein